jgi:hypothetical protein
VDASSWAVSGVVIAALIGVGTLLVASQTLRDTRDRAGASAERAENAARLAIDNNDRLVGAIGAITLANGEPGRPRGVRWTLVHDRGSLYLLENVGGASAHGVEVTAHPTMARFEIRNGDLAEIREGEALTLFAVPAWQTTDRTITVTWQDGPDSDGAERRTWGYPLPRSR